jgi:hypothetical protein
MKMDGDELIALLSYWNDPAGAFPFQQQILPVAASHAIIPLRPHELIAGLRKLQKL